jgi:tetratricopeptide (TPR) repeat protein
MSKDKLALARQELAEAKGRLGSDRAPLQGLAEEIDTLDAALARFQRFLGLVEQAHDAEAQLSGEPAVWAKTDRGIKSAPAVAESAGNDPAKAVPFVLQALSCYQVMERDDWLAGLERDLGQDGLVRQVRRSLYEELLWLADDALRRGQDHRSGGKLSAAEAARQGLAYLDKAEAAWGPTRAFYSFRAACRWPLGKREAARADRTLARNTPPASAFDHYLLGQAARAARNKAGAIKEYEAALRLEPTHYWSLMCLGICLCDQGEQGQDFAAAAAVFTGCILKRPEHGAAWYIRGVAHWRLRQYDKAIADYSRAIELKADETAVRHKRGLAHAALHQYDRAIADYSRAIELKADFAEAWSNRGACRSSLHQYDRAIADCSRAIKLKADFAPAWCNRGNAHQSLRQHAKAIADYSKAIELDADLEAAWNNRGVCHADLGQYDRAIADHSRAIELKADDAAAWNNRGAAHTRLRCYDKAVADHSKAIALDPKLASAHTNLGVALALQGHLDEAVAAHRKAIALDPKSAPAHTNLGVALAKQNKLDEAVAAHRKGIALDPELAAAHYNLGTALAKQKKLDEAIAAYRKAIALDLEYAAAHNALGDALAQQMKWDEAVAEFHKAIALDSKNAHAHSGLGIVLANQGKMEEAVAELRKAVALDPNGNILGGNSHARIHVTLGAALYQRGKLNEAAAEYRKAIELDPKYARGRWGLGQVLTMQGKVDEAVAELRKAVALDPNDFGIQFYLGLVLCDRKRAYAGAIVAFRKAIALKPDAAEGHNALGCALQAKGRLGEAIAEFRDAVRLKKAWPLAHLNLRRALLEAGQLRQAAEEYRLALAQDASGDLEAWLDYASLLLLDKKDDAYRGACKSVLERFGKSEKGGDLYLLARILALAPNGVTEPALAVERAKKAVAGQSKAGWVLHTLALSHYRAGNFEEAVSGCRKSMTENPTWGGQVVNWFLLAMAHQRLGHKEEARQWLDKAVSWVDEAQKKLPRDTPLLLPVPSWSDRLEVQLLRREADALLDGAEKNKK